MAAAQVAKKLKDKRQKRTMEEIFKKVSRTKGFKIVSNFRNTGLEKNHSVDITMVG